MTKQRINIGQSANDKAGDPLRTAFSKVNDNFDELFNSVSAGVVAGSTAPTDPGEGDLWWDSESGRIYVYYDASWVDASPVDGAGISSTNELVNGAYTVSLGSDGRLTLPNQGKIGGSDVNSFLTFNWGDDVELKGGDNLYLSGSVATIRTNGNANQWTFGTDGALTLPAGGTVSYTPATPADWNGTAPTTMQAAIDRLAAAFKILNSGTGA